jgi:hypothetical protein
MLQVSQFENIVTIELIASITFYVIPTGKN